MNMIKKPPVDYRIPVWIWQGKDAWIFSRHPYEPITPFYVASGWHIDKAKENFLWFTGIPERLVDFQIIECPDYFKDESARDPKARKQIEESIKRKLEKPIIGTNEIENKGKAVAAHRMVTNSNGHVKKEFYGVKRKYCDLTKKVRYTKSEAESEAKRYNMIAHREELNAYQCKSCSWWHVGHQPGWVKNGGMDRALATEKLREKGWKVG